MKTGVQSLGWYVLRAPDPVPLIRFYRDVLGLSELRGRETPPEQASAMLWAGGTTVFEPNRLRTGDDLTGSVSSIETSSLLPIFHSADLKATQGRLNLQPATQHGHTYYYQDPLGFLFGLEAASTPEPPSSYTGVDSLAADITRLGRLEYRTGNPDQVAAFYRDVLGLKPMAPPHNNHLDMGDGAMLAILSGGTAASLKVADREDATMVPVFRLYGYDTYVEIMKDNQVPCLQEVELTGGRLWYGWDPAGQLFGFQERKPPDPDPDKWTTRLPEDLMARQLWKER